MNKWLYLAAWLIPLVSIVSFTLGGWFYFLTPAVVFVLVPTLDFVLGVNTRNETEARYKELKEETYYRWITGLYVPFQFALIVWCARRIGVGDLALFEMIGLTLSIGIVSGGLGITVAHELGHRTNKIEQNLSKALLWMVCYMHFFIEHNQGHHARVATEEDPATSRLGESFYRFYPRTLIGGFKSAWGLEVRRLARRNQAVWSHHNQMVWFVIAPVLLIAALGLLFGPLAAAFFVVQSWIAFSLLEIINYVEHYGLRREQSEAGRFEKVQPRHSWNAAQTLTNCLLFHLQRHSDHHANPNRRYQTLRHYEDAPQLPTGYGGMVLLALAPPLWRRVMDPRVKALR